MGAPYSMCTQWMVVWYMGVSYLIFGNFGRHRVLKITLDISILLEEKCLIINNFSKTILYKDIYVVGML